MDKQTKDEAKAVEDSAERPLQGGTRCRNQHARNVTDIY